MIIIRKELTIFDKIAIAGVFIIILWICFSVVRRASNLLSDCETKCGAEIKRSEKILNGLRGQKTVEH